MRLGAKAATTGLVSATNIQNNDEPLASSHPHPASLAVRGLHKIVKVMQSLQTESDPVSCEETFGIAWSIKANKRLLA